MSTMMTQKREAELAEFIKGCDEVDLSYLSHMVRFTAEDIVRETERKKQCDVSRGEFEKLINRVKLLETK